MRLGMANADDGYCDLITALGNCSGNARGPFVLADCAREVGRPTPNLFNTEAHKAIAPAHSPPQSDTIEHSQNGEPETLQTTPRQRPIAPPR
jgi:hypothetical protein